MPKLNNLDLAKVGVSEEMGELQQVIGKIDRFGYRSKHPQTGESNLAAMAGEIGDLYGALAFWLEEVSRHLTEQEVADFLFVLEGRRDEKKAKLIRYNEERGGEGDL